MAYKRTNWKSGAEGGTLVTDERLNNIEDGIQQAVEVAEQAQNGIPPLALPDTVMTAVQADPTSQFSTALDTRFGRLAEARFDASGAPNGAITVMDSGQSVAIFGDVDLYVAAGEIVQPPLAEAGVGGYLEVPLGGTLAHIGATFKLTDVASGTVVLVAPSASWDAGGVVSAGVHFGIWRTGWAFTVYESATGGEKVVTQGVLDLPLNTPLDVDVYVRGETATMVFPDGSLAHAQDPRIAQWLGSYAIWETFEVDGSTQVPPRLLSLRADTTAGAPAYESDMFRRESLATPTVRAVGDAVNWDITTVEANIGSNVLDMAFAWPNSGTILVTISIHLQMVGADNILMRPRTSAADGQRMSVLRTAHSGMITCSWVVSGGAAGAADTLTWEALRVGGATTAKVHIGTDYGFATVGVIPAS